MLDTSKAFEKSILEDILFSHMGNLDDLRCMPNGRVHLLDPIRPAPARLRNEIQQALGSTGEVLHSSAAVRGGGYKIHMNDR